MKVDIMIKELWTTFAAGFPFIVLNGGDFGHMMDEWGHMMGNWDHMVDLGGIPFLGLWFIGSLIVIILIFAYLIIHSEKKEEIEIMSDAQKTLDERYVKGEITRKEYIQAKEDIERKK
ncbi:MAG: hypothetical protein ACXACC_10540 [Promethearchaeota archaeon]